MEETKRILKELTFDEYVQLSILKNGGRPAWLVVQGKSGLELRKDYLKNLKKLAKKEFPTIKSREIDNNFFFYDEKYNTEIDKLKPGDLFLIDGKTDTQKVGELIGYPCANEFMSSMKKSGVESWIFVGIYAITKHKISINDGYYTLNYLKDITLLNPNFEDINEDSMIYPITMNRCFADTDKLEEFVKTTEKFNNILSSDEKIKDLLIENPIRMFIEVKYNEEYLIRKLIAGDKLSDIEKEFIDKYLKKYGFNFSYPINWKNKTHRFLIVSLFVLIEKKKKIYENDTHKLGKELCDSYSDILKISDM